MRSIVAVVVGFGISIGVAQGQSADSIKASQPFTVIVKAYEQNRRLLEVAGSVGVLGQTQLNRFGNNSLVPAINTLPGVRMEERSPGSFRINIRGSSLRAPFGVRNVKVYYNGFSLTDPGGNTYLNQLGFFNVQSLEVIKGPGSSLYGSGTGGVLLINSLPANGQTGFEVEQSVGSYGLSNTHIGVTVGNKSSLNSVQYQRVKSNGYRNHSAVDRQVLSWDASVQHNNNVLTVNMLYSDLSYQTPGGLNLAEFTTNPKAARPRVGAAPGAEQVKAAIYLKTFVAGASYQQVFSSRWQNTTSLYGAFAELKNPAIRNYGRNAEPHFGARTTLQYTSPIKNEQQITWQLGGEVQQAYNTVQVFRNKAGNPDSLLTNDEINNNQHFIFTQLSYQLKQWYFTAGLSVNKSAVTLLRTTNVPALSLKRSFDNQLTPRISALNKVTDNVSVYGSFAKGFSPPTIGELLPSGSAINADLNAETGYSTEVGTRGSAIQNRLAWDINFFLYRLTNTIVQRRDALGGDFFINAGASRQQGLETYVSYRLGKPTMNAAANETKVWSSITLNRFRYKDFKQLDNNFSGKAMPGVAPQYVTLGADWFSNFGLYVNATYQYSSRIALNDANTAYANAFNLLDVKTGYQCKAGKKIRFEVYAGVSNLLNETYSLGNDINAFGGRYYNAAAGRNYFAGLLVKGVWDTK